MGFNRRFFILSGQFITTAGTRKKSSPYRSAMSMLTFYINRAGEKSLGESQKTVLEKAKNELQKKFG
jgi:hypothetical protein